MVDNSIKIYPPIVHKRISGRLTVGRFGLVAFTLDAIAVLCAVYFISMNEPLASGIDLPVWLVDSHAVFHGLQDNLSHLFSCACSVTASAALIFLSGLYFSGSYDARELLHLSRTILRIVWLWALCLMTVFIIAASLEPGADIRLFRPTDMSIALAVLASRCAFVLFVSRCGYAQRLRTEKTLFVVERPNLEHSQLSISGDYGMTLYIPCFANAPKFLLDLLVDVAAEKRRDDIVLVLGASSLSDCVSLANAMGVTDKQVALLSTKDQPELHGAFLRQDGSGHVYLLQKAPLDETGQRIKRAMDLVIATALCVMTAPLLLLIAVAVKATSRGPAFYAQARTGRNGRTFTILKFRSMTVHGSGDSIVQAVRGDKRVTPLGRWLRCTSLDELPQLINVLKGEMSLIGPRPHAVAHDVVFAAKIPGYERRFRVRPGISGLAQVSGYRGETSTDDAISSRVALDLAYIDSWSFGGDLHLLVRTFFAVVSPRNAY